MSPGLRRSDRPIEKAGIAPDAIRRRTVRTDTLRIVAVSPTVMSGSRREARPAAPYCLLPDRRSLTASASRSVDLPVPQSLWSDRSRAFELERWPGETSAAAQEGRWGDVTFDLDFDWPRIEFVVAVQRVEGRGAVSSDYIGRAGNPRSSTKRGRQVGRCHPPRLQDRNNKPHPETRHKSAEVLGPAAQHLRVRKPGGRIFPTAPVVANTEGIRHRAGLRATSRLRQLRTLHSIPTRKTGRESDR